MQTLRSNLHLALPSLWLWAAILAAPAVARAPFAPGPEPAASNCTTVIPGGLVNNQYWPLTGSPYCIAGDIQINHLTIEAGVKVFVDGDYRIEVLNDLTAQGTSNRHIVFTSSAPPARWQGILFSNVPAGSELTYCDITLASNSGLRLANSAPTIRHCRIFDNTTPGDGGGVHIDVSNADVIIEDSVISGNRSGVHGGGLRAIIGAGYSLVLSGCVVADNVANPSFAGGNYVGGGAHVSGTSVFSDCRFQGNSANSYCHATFGCNVLTRGGALYSDGDCFLERCLFTDNEAVATNGGDCFFGGISEAYGAAVYVSAGLCSMQNTTLGCNTTSAGGGGCSAYNRGGGLYLASGTAALDNCTLARNSSQGVYNAGGSASATNSILYYNNSNADQYAGTVDFDYCDVQNWSGGGTSFDVNPIFAGTGCDAFLDLVIVSGSQCVDAGNPSSAFDDACRLPGLDGLRNDLGTHGGPGNCGLGSYVGAAYCDPANANSTGQPGVMDAWSPILGQLESLTLTASQLPPNEFGYFLVSQGTGTFVPPGSQGVLCLVGGSIGRFKASLFQGPVGRSIVDLTHLPFPTFPAVHSGETWNFQCWYRDKNPNQTSNFTDAVAVTFM